MASNYIAFFPTLPIAKNIELGEWCVGTPPAETPWCSDRFKELVGLLQSSIKDDGFENGALVWHRERGFDGALLQPRVAKALQAAVTFAALDANDHVRDNPNAAHFLATSENAELFIQPIDDDGRIVHREGGALRSVGVLGLRIGEQPFPLPDAVVPIRFAVLPSQRLAQAVFQTVLDETNEVSRRIAIAMEWHRFALSNPVVVTLQQRIIAFKTGFEALLRTSNSRKGATRLRRLFETATAPHVQLLPWAGVLWSPRERTDLQREWDGQTEMRSELEDWFLTLARVRNSIIHEGVLPTHQYEAPSERPLSRYAGHLFWTADRVLREAVKASIGVEVLLGARLDEHAESTRLGEMLAASIEEMRQQREQAPAAAETEPTGPVDPDDEHDAINKVGTASPPAEEDEQESVVQRAPVEAHRDLAALLQSLQCDAGNKIRMRKAVAQPSPTLEGADANARAVRGMWIASYEKRSIAINVAERDILEAAGAEYELPRHWSRWD